MPASFGVTLRSRNAGLLADAPEARNEVCVAQLQLHAVAPRSRVCHRAGVARVPLAGVEVAGADLGRPAVEQSGVAEGVGDDVPAARVVDARQQLLEPR